MKTLTESCANSALALNGWRKHDQSHQRRHRHPGAIWRLGIVAVLGQIQHRQGPRATAGSRECDPAGTIARHAQRAGGQLSGGGKKRGDWREELAENLRAAGAGPAPRLDRTGLHDPDRPRRSGGSQEDFFRSQEPHARKFAYLSPDQETASDLSVKFLLVTIKAGAYSQARSSH